MSAKELIHEAIERKKAQVAEEYDKKIERLERETNIANIYYLLAEAFHNTMEQGEIGIKFLKNNLTNEFFKKAEVKNSANYIVFSDDEYEIRFSKSLVKTIEIKTKKIERPYGFYRPLNKDIIKLGDAIEAFLKERTFKNFKVMADCNDRGYDKGIISQVFKYVNAYKKCNEELLKKIRERQKEDKERKKQVDEEREAYEQEVQEAKEFIKTLTDLKVFKEAGWIIKERIG